MLETDGRVERPDGFAVQPVVPYIIPGSKYMTRIDTNPYPVFIFNPIDNRCKLHKGVADTRPLTSRGFKKQTGSFGVDCIKY